MCKKKESFVLEIDGKKKKKKKKRGRKTQIGLFVRHVLTLNRAASPIFPRHGETMSERRALLALVAVALHASGGGGVHVVW
jgi:hypothetical protein